MACMGPQQVFFSCLVSKMIWKKFYANRMLRSAKTLTLTRWVKVPSPFGKYTRAGTRLFKNRRLIEYLKEATRSARLGTRSVLGAAGKVEIWIIFDIKQSKKCQHKTSTFAFLFLFNPPNITKPSICRTTSCKHDGKLCICTLLLTNIKKVIIGG